MRGPGTGGDRAAGHFPHRAGSSIERVGWMDGTTRRRSNQKFSTPKKRINIHTMYKSIKKRRLETIFYAKHE